MVSPTGSGLMLLIGGEVGCPAWLEIHKVLIGLVILLDADPARQSEGCEYSRRERDSSRTCSDENGFEKRRRDRSPDDDTRKWHTDSAVHPGRRDRKDLGDQEKERRGREASSEAAAIATLPTPPEPAHPLVNSRTPPPPPTNGHTSALSTSTQDPHSGISFLEQLKQAAGQVSVEVSPLQDQLSSLAPLLSSVHVQSIETNSLPSGPPSATLSPITDPIATTADIRCSTSKSNPGINQISLNSIPCRRLQPPRICS